MKNKLLLFVATCLPMLVMGQKNVQELRSAKISEFMNHMYVSTSSDPMAIIKAKQLKVSELQAQELISTTTTTTLKSSKQKTAVASETGAGVDTTYAYPWDANAQDWSTTQVARMIKTYDTQHNLILYQTYTKNPDTHEWMDSVQYSYTYNESNQVINIIQQSWYPDFGWFNVDNSTYEYNALGQKTKFVYKYWNWDIYDWDFSWQQELFYDSNGLNTMIVESQWDAANSIWTEGIKSTNQYDQHLTSNLLQYWDSNSNGWVNSYQYLYEYDANGNNTIKKTNTWKTDGYWNNYLLQTNTFNDLGKIDNYVTQIWDPFLFEWVNNQRGIYRYDSTGNNICIQGEKYDATTNTWKSSWKNIYDYNQENKQISSASLYWDVNTGAWSSGTKTKSFKIKLNDGSQQIIAKNLKVYPNPVKSIITIESNSNISEIKLLNLSGQEVLIKSYYGPSTIELNVSNLNSGIYILKIQNSDGSIMKEKIIKQ